MDAFSMLVEFEKLTQVEILSYECKSCDKTLVYDIDKVMSNFKTEYYLQNQFLQNYYATSNSFIQLIGKSISTHIGNNFIELANKGMPYALYLDKANIDKQDKVYNFIQESLKKQEISTFAIQHHNRNLFCISYVHELGKYAITMKEITILCQDKQELYEDQDAMHKEVLEIAEIFFQNTRISENWQFQEDLIGRSLIGIQESRTIKYFGIVEHYDLQKCKPFNEVKQFLNYYQLECAHIEQVETKNLESICNQFSSQHLTQYYNSQKGWTIYFFSGAQFLTCCFIENRQYKIISQILRQAQNPQIPNQYQFLKQWNLPEIEEHFYQKTMDFIVEYKNKFGPNISKPKLVQIAFNAINQRLKSIPQLIHDLKNLQQCFQEELIILLPIALKGSGFSELYQQMVQICNEVTIVNSVDKIILNNRVVCINDSFDPNSAMDAIAKINKLPTNAHITVIALMNQGKVYHIQDAFYPFSLNYMINCMLKCNDEDKLKTLIQEIKRFENNKMNLKIGDYQIESRYHNSNNSSQDQDLYSELLVTDFNDTLKNEDKIGQLFESLQNSKVPMQTLTQSYYSNEAKYTLEQIEKITKIKLNKKNVQFKGKSISGLFIENPDWEILDNFVLDGLEILSKNANSNQSKIQDLFELLKGQLFDGQKIVYQRESYLYISTNQIHKNYNKVEIDTMIVVLNGLIILYPRQLNANIKYLDIPIYSYNLDVTKSSIVVSQLQKDLKNLQNKKLKTNNDNDNDNYFLIKENKIIINEKEWPTYIIKQEPFEVDLVGKIMEK